MSAAGKSADSPSIRAICTGGEICNNGVDDNFNGFTDCADIGCLGNPSCPLPVCGDGVVVFPEQCDPPNGLTCNGNCQTVNPGFEAFCDNGTDDDFDLQIDCNDFDCFGNPACVGVEICTNGLDDDFDGLADCQDDECFGDPNCNFGFEAFCADFFDNDFDGLTDCEDPDCAFDPSCGICGDGFISGFEQCDDGNFNDGDGCSSACVFEFCGDGIIQGSLGEECEPPGVNGCDDSCQVANTEVCENNPNDLTDDDGDGLSDCSDDDCFGEAACSIGIRKTGAACTTHSECDSVNGAPACLENPFGAANFPGGYCSEFCDASGACAGAGTLGGICFNPGLAQSICLDVCASQANCRAGYICTAALGTQQQVCIPFPN